MAEGHSNLDVHNVTETGDYESNSATNDSGNDVSKQAEGSTKSETNDLNTFQQKDSKKIDKKTLDKEMTDESQSSSEASASEDSVAAEIDDDIASIQAQAVMAVAKAMKIPASNPTDAKQNNLDIEAAMSGVIGGAAEQSQTSSGSDARLSFTECQRAAQLAHKAAEDAREVASSGHSLMDTISATIEVLQSHVFAFLEKARDVSGGGTDRDFAEADFYHVMASKYESAVKVLKNKARRVEIALNRVEEAATESLKYAILADEITNEELEESIRTKFSACWWKNKSTAAIIVALKKEHSAILTMRRIWINVRNDVNAERRSNSSSDSLNEYNQECENRDRKTRIAHIAALFIGLTFLAMTVVFKVGSDSFYAVLALGAITTAWAIMYWILRLCKHMKSRDTHETVIETEQRDGFLENADRRLRNIESLLRKYNTIPDTESEMGSLETVRVDDISQ